MTLPAELPIRWTASMISPADDLDGAPILEKDFALDEGHGRVDQAHLHVSSLGVFEATLNDSPVGDDVLSPGWTSYEWRVRYRSYDVKQLVQPVSHLSVQLGNGWYRGRLGWSSKHGHYGDRLGLIVQLEVRFADGHTQIIVTDRSWRARRSATLANDLYDGQIIDARLRKATPDWVPVEQLQFDPARLTPYIGPPVRRHETLKPHRIWTSPAGKTLVDFGQNLVGWIRLRAHGERGTTITIRHAEVLEHDELGTRPLRTAKATDQFILGGDDDAFEPTLTFHGFRYAEVAGYPGELTADVIEAVVVHSDIRRTGDFECSNALLNQLHRNVVWSLRGNFVDLPTDCPQRDERLGWTGDISVFAPTAAFLYDVNGVLVDWLRDLAAEQAAQDGRVPTVVPDVLKFERDPMAPPQIDSTAIWGDASVWVPWALWQAYGDQAVLRGQYPSMAAWTRRVASLLSANGLWDTGFQFGDWLDPDAPPDKPWQSKVDPAVVATASFYRTACIVADTARLLGIAGDAEEFGALAERTRRAFNQHYVELDGTIHNDAATAYALAIVFGLLDTHVAQRAGDRLAKLVEERRYRIATGFAGTPYVTDALTMTGHIDAAYRLLLETGCPSFLYPVTMGATTIWERWDSMLPDGTINPGEMTSFNHYALGAVADWVHRTVGGIAPLTPGYGRVLVAPRPGGELNWARTSLQTGHGRITVEWRVATDRLTVTVELPDDVDGVLNLDGTAIPLIGGKQVHVAPR